MAVEYSTQTVLITGASSGIGRSFAQALAQRGASLVLVARRQDRLEALAAELRHNHAVPVAVFPADLSSAASAAELHTAIRAAGIRVTGLINNAGFGTFEPFVDEDAARLADEIAVDVLAPVVLSRAFLPDIRATGDGFLINVASMAAYTPAPRMAVYAAAKAFILSFTEALWAETRGTGVTVFAVSPGATATEFNTVVGTDDATSGATMRTAEDVVATALRHLDRRRPGPSVIDGMMNRMGAAAARVPSRRVAVSLMNRLTGPARRGR